MAMAATDRQIFYHVDHRNKDGTALRCRVNGKCQVWKTRPLEFRLPTKIGFYGYGEITDRNKMEWLEFDCTIPTAVNTQ